MEQEVTIEQLKSLKALADINIKVSAIKNTLSELEKTEKEYIEKRENEVHEKIQEILKESALLLSTTKHNFEEVKSFHNETTTIVDTLNEMYSKYIHFVEKFEEKTAVWEKTYKKQLEEIATLRKEAENQQKVNEKDKEDIKKQQKKLREDTAHLESKQQTLLASIEEIKKLKK